MSKPYPFPQQDEIFFGLGKVEKDSVLNIPEVKVRFYEEDAKKFHGSARDPEALWEFIRNQIFEPGEMNVQERAIAIFTNAGGNIIGYWKQAIGGVDKVIIDPRIVLLAAVKCLATGIVLAHNHPGGVAKPSDADLKATEKFIHAAFLFNIQVWDHIIVTRSEFLSFYQEGIIQRIVERLLDKEMTMDGNPEPFPAGKTNADELRLEIKEQLLKCKPGTAPRICKFIRNLKGYRQAEEWIIEICLKDQVAIGTAIMNIETEILR